MSGCSLIPKNDLPELNPHFISQIDSLSKKWKLLRTDIGSKLNSIIPWRKLMLDNTILKDIDKKKLHQFRKEMNELLNNICSETLLDNNKSLRYCDNTDLIENKSKCFAFGSNNLESDIDVTIAGHCMSSNLIILKIIKYTLFKLFSDDYIFFSINGFSISNVHIFFDINYYLTDFFMRKNKEYSPNKLSSYFITLSPHQYRFAFYEYLKLHKPLGSECKEEIVYDDLALDIDKYYKASKRDTDNKIIIDDLLYKVSNLSTYQDECYHTQGAFFHVVLLMQAKKQYEDLNDEESNKKYTFLVELSLLENFCFSVTHFSRKDKYLGRVKHALNCLIDNSKSSKLRDYLLQNNINNNLIDTLIQTPNNLNDIIVIVDKLKNKYIEEIKYNDYVGLLGGNKLNFKKMIKNGISVKKNILGRERVVYTDKKRIQYVKINNNYEEIRKLK
jgi:hypothetical protein